MQDKVKPLTRDERLDPIWQQFFEGSKYREKFLAPIAKNVISRKEYFDEVEKSSG